MRRIPRPSRAIFPTHPLCLYTCQRASLLHRSQSLVPCAYPQTAFAAFSTSSSSSFLLPGGKQDKRKHQQFVRRWQKRLLGDSEPIGAHVDPYDPTSPVRIAPEEQGEYEEVLEEDRTGAEIPTYEPAQRVDRLLRVGGEQWLKQKVEGDIAKEFEKLTLHTYTPMTLDMANEIEELTGTPYTLRDENLMMAQSTHLLTARPYTDYNFGLHKKLTSLNGLRSRFLQAVSEIYTLKQAGLDMDMSKFPNRGVYSPPGWVKDIKIVLGDNEALELIFPPHRNPELFLQAMQTVPAWESTLVDEELEPLLEEVTVVQEASELQGESLSSMEPSTPGFKKTAMVKVDEERKPFDFMSNRPVPRSAHSREEELNDTNDALVTVQNQSRSATIKSPAELIAAVGASQSTIGELRHLFLEYRSQRLTDNILALRDLALQGNSGSTAPQADDAKWRRIRINDDRLKFALFKRLFQLTGIRLSDPQISSVNTLGELYNFCCTAAKPQPTSLFSRLHTEGQRARERAKRQHSISRGRADLGDLINLGHVELRRVKPTKTEKRSKLGLDKVIQYALWERGLSNRQMPKVAHTRKRESLVLEGTRKVPEFGKPIGGAAAEYLSKKTRQLKNQ